MTDMKDRRAARRVLCHFLGRDPTAPDPNDTDVAKFVELLGRNEVSSLPNRVGMMWTWLACQVQHRAGGLIAAVPSMPPLDEYAATQAFVSWSDANDEHRHSGPTLAWALVRALAALLEAEASTGQGSQL